MRHQLGNMMAGHYPSAVYKCDIPRIAPYVIPMLSRLGKGGGGGKGVTTIWNIYFRQVSNSPRRRDALGGGA